MKIGMAVFVAILMLAILAGCKPQSEIGITPTRVDNDSVVVVNIGDHSTEVKVAAVVVQNFHRGARAEALFRIFNMSNNTIMPLIYPIMDADVSHYSKATDYVNAPFYVKDWIQIQALTPVSPNTFSDFLVTLQMPKDVAEKPPSRFAFQIGVSRETKNFMVSAISVWWLVNMR